MKILLVHNNYGKRSGEEAVVDKMDAIFKSIGHDVAQLRMTTEGVRESVAGKVRGFLSGMYSPGGVRLCATRCGAKSQMWSMSTTSTLSFPLRHCSNAGRQACR